MYCYLSIPSLHRIVTNVSILTIVGFSFVVVWVTPESSVKLRSNPSAVTTLQDGAVTTTMANSRVAALDRKIILSPAINC